MSRNAVLARENRQKKKEYVQSLEKTLKNLNDQNSNLKLKTEAMAGRISDLASEVEY
jgi:predicted RNase H-like nuclease (RuvC/YqgF family)